LPATVGHVLTTLDPRTCDVFRLLGRQATRKGIVTPALRERYQQILQRYRYYLRSLDDENEGVWGVAFSGQVPCHAVTSLGVTSSLTQKPRSVSPPFSIAESIRIRRGDPGYVGTDYPCSYHLLLAIRNNATGQVVPTRTFLQSHGGMPRYMGLRDTSSDGMTVHTPMAISGRSPDGQRLDFVLGGMPCS
jgi:hypothetical protein